MKKIIKDIISRILWFFALERVKRNRPIVIGVGGSVGKTTTKEAVYEVVKIYDESAIKSQKSYNTDIGVPLTLVGMSTSTSILVWVWRSIFLLFVHVVRLDRRFNAVVLEMGADKRGDLEFLTSRIKPNISVVTKIGPEHMEFFGSIKSVIQEESQLITCLDKKDIAILNADDHLIVQMAKKTKAQILWYGTAKSSEVRADNIEVRRDGIHFVIRYGKEVVPMGIDSFGRHHIYPVLAAFTVGVALGMKINDISRGLKSFRLPEGRGVVMDGINDTIIIDDTYNASPVSVISSLGALQDTKILSPYGRRVAVLGDMLELGDQSAGLHQEIAEELFGKADVVVAVGEQAKNIFNVVNKNKKILSFWFPGSEEASREISSIIKKKDIVLVKGSRGVRMDKIVRVLTKI